MYNPIPNIFFCQALLCPNRKLRKYELRSSFLVSPSVILAVTFYMIAQLLKRFNTCTAKTAASKLSDAAVYSFNKWTRVNRARRNHGVIPTRQVETQSKLFCIDHLIPFGLIWYQLSQSYGVSDFLLSKSYQGMLSFYILKVIYIIAAVLIHHRIFLFGFFAILPYRS